VFVFANFVYWSSATKREMRRAHRMELDRNAKVVPGKTTLPLQRPEAARFSEDQCFSVITPERSLDLTALSVDERDKWAAAFRLFIGRLR
jgi:hypothetical protein